MTKQEIIQTDQTEPFSNDEINKSFRYYVKNFLPDSYGDDPFKYFPDDYPFEEEEELKPLFLFNTLALVVENPERYDDYKERVFNIKELQIVSKFIEDNYPNQLSTTVLDSLIEYHGNDPTLLSDMITYIKIWEKKLMEDEVNNMVLENMSNGRKNREKYVTIILKDIL